MHCICCGGGALFLSKPPPRTPIDIDCATPPRSAAWGDFSAPRSPPRTVRRRALALGLRGVLQICAKYPNLAQPGTPGCSAPWAR